MKENIEIDRLIESSLFLIGAGFSRDAGCLTSVQMFEDLKKRIFDESSQTFSPTQKDALKFLISCLRYHSEWRTMETENSFKFDPNIEELALLIRRIRNRENFLPYPITGNWADKLVQLEAAYANESESNSNLFDSLERVLKKLLRDEWVMPADNEKLQYLAPLTEFLKSHSQTAFKLDIFSLNYDTVIEDHFQSDDEVPWRGFSNGQWSHVEPDEKNDPNARINLYKLHGSIDWVRLVDTDTWELSKLEDKGKFAENIDERHNPYIIFGQGSKSFSVEPFFSLVHHFNRTLNCDSKRYIFVIGYSFFDPYINNLLFNATKGSKKLIIVNPSFAPEYLFEIDESTSWPKPDEEDYYRAVFQSECSRGDLSDFMREIQKNAFYSELPEFNFLTVSAENIEYLPLTAADFIGKYFAKGGQLLQSYLESFERQRHEEEPF